MGNKKRKWVLRSGIILCVCAALLITGAGYQNIAMANDEINYPPPGELIDVNGHLMHLYCAGTGSPTVVLESGSGETHLNWSAVQAEVALITRVCSYDRPGFGWSDPTDDVIYSPDVAESLHTLLNNAGETGPYILVGHSYGGIHVRSFAHLFPDDVSGIVLVDSSHDQQRANDPDEGKNPLIGICRMVAPFGLIRILDLAESHADANPYLTQNQRQMLIATMNRTHYCQAIANEEAAADVDMSQPELQSLDDIPLIVLTATQTANRLADQLLPDVIDQVNTLWAEKQRELVALSSNSEQILADDSAHYIQYDQSELIVDAIQQMIAMASTN